MHGFEPNKSTQWAAKVMNQLPSRRSLVEIVENDLPVLSKAFQRIAGLLVNAPGKFMILPIQGIAAAAAVSDPSVIRFCRRYGYKGMPDFRIALAMSLAEKNASFKRPFLEPTVADKAFVNRDLKLAIARKARKLVEADRSLILDSGSTTQLFAEQLRTLSGRTILTTGLNIIEALWGCDQHALILPGGRVRFEARALTGRFVEDSLQNMQFDTVYFGADSIDPMFGLSTFNEEEARQSEVMMKVSRRIVVLVDSTKFRAPSLHRFCNIDRIDTIVTDRNIPEDFAVILVNRGINLLIADLT
jgi:DeoR family transcriptional regulator, aga operon transcriptional repressor